MADLGRRGPRAALGLIALVGGCIPLPFAVPPTSVSVAPGVAIGTIVPPEDQHLVTESGTAIAHEGINTEPALHGRVGARPLGLVERLDARRFDFQLGYTFEYYLDAGMSHYNKHGGFAGLTHYPWLGEVNGDWRGRLGINAIGDVLTDVDDRDVGGGLTFALEIEYYTIANGSYAGFDNKGVGVIGGATGEYGIGLHTAAGVRGIGTSRYWIVTAGLSFRLPAAGGILLIPIWELD